MSPATAKYHVSEILSKLGAQTREEAAAWQWPSEPQRAWWASAVALLSSALRRLAPLTIAKTAITGVGIAALVGLSVLAWSVLQTSGEESSERSNLNSSPDVQASSVDISTPDPLAPPIVQRPLGQVLHPLPTTTEIAEAGSYLVDTETGQIWKTEGLESWSPDGTKFTRTFCCSGDRGMDVVDMATGNATRISDEWVYQSAWSSDGSKIAFSKFNGSASEGVYVINPDGSGFMKLAESTGTGFPSWSPSGDYILAISPPTGGIADLITIASGEKRTLTGVEHAAWSPKTDTMALASQSGLRLMDAESGEQREILSGRTDNINWAPDGSRLIVYREGPSCGGSGSPVMVRLVYGWWEGITLAAG